MANDEPLDPLLTGLYQTTEDFAAWTPFLASLCAATKTDNAALVLHDLATDKVVTVFCHLDPEQVKRYRDTYAKLNPWTAAVRAAGPALNPPGTVSFTEEVLPLEELRQSTFYREWGHANNVVHGIALNLGVQEGRFTYLCLSNGETSGPASPHAARLLSALYPHVARVVRLQAGGLSARGLLDVLDRTAGAVLVLTPRGAVVEATPSAEALLSAGVLLRRDGDGVVRAVDRAAQTKLEHALEAPTSVRYQVIRLNPGTWGVLTQMQHAPEDTRFQPGYWMLTVASPAGENRGQEELAAELGLTPAEARLARALMQYGSLTPAAKALGVSRNTAKSQLARVFERTGTKRQTEVVRLFSSLGVLLQGRP